MTATQSSFLQNTEPFLFSFPRRRSSLLDRPTSPTTSAVDSVRDPCSPQFSDSGAYSPRSRQGSQETHSHHGKRKGSVFSFWSGSSRKTSFDGRDGDEIEEEPACENNRLHSPWEGIPGARTKGTKSWTRRMSRAITGRSSGPSAAAEQVKEPCPHVESYRPYNIESQSPKVGQMQASYEVSFLDSVIPEEGLIEDMNYGPDQTIPGPPPKSGSNRVPQDIEWFSSEEDARKRAEELSRGRERTSGHWLHSTPDDKANATKEAEQLECDNDRKSTHSNNSSISPERAKRSQSGTTILGRLTSMAGLSSTNKDKNFDSKRDRASSVPMQRKASKHNKASNEAKRAISGPIPSNGGALIRRDRAKSIAHLMGNDQGLMGENNFQESSAPNAGHLTVPEIEKIGGGGNSMWDSFQRRKTRAMSIFSPRGAYTAVPAN